MIEEDSIYDYAPEQPEGNNDEYGDDLMGEYSCSFIVPNFRQPDMVNLFLKQMRNIRLEGYSKFTVEKITAKLAKGDGIFVEMTGTYDVHTDDLRDTFTHDVADVVESLTNKKLPDFLDVNLY